MTGNYPLNSWYVAATSDEVSGVPATRTLLSRPVVFFRDQNGQVVALEDRCAHRGYPLSSGRLESGRIVCGYHGFNYDYSGACVAVPSQPQPPIGAKVASYETREADGFVWIWLGEPALARLSPVPELPWLAEGWSSTGTNVHVEANYMLVHDHYLDLTHIPEVHPKETPPGLLNVPPLDSIEVSEASVTYARNLPPAPLADWEAEATGLRRDSDYERHHFGRFISPGVLAEGWEIRSSTNETFTQVRIQAVTPETDTTTHLFWRFSRDYATDDPNIGANLHEVFEHVMRVDVDVIERIEATVGHQPTGSRVKVAADAGVLKVHQIVDAMLNRERR